MDEHRVTGIIAV